MRETRRDFFKTASSVAFAGGRVLGANDRIRLAGLGTGGRCSYLLSLALKAGGTELAAICDVYEPRRLAVREKLAPRAPDFVDYREVLDRKDIDAVIVGSPDHWHVPMTSDAVAAGKDVYVEKPVSHSIEEGDQLQKSVEGSRQVVQVGYQQRSWEHFQKGA